MAKGSSEAKHVQLIVYITKALIVKGSPSAQTCWSLMQNLLDDAPESQSLYTAQEFSTLFDDDDNMTVSFLLYKQKYFLINLPKLLESYKVYITAIG